MNNIQELRRKILNPQLLPFTHQIINVQNFLRDNQQFFDKLKSSIEESKRNLQNPNRRAVKSKSVSKFTIGKNSLPIQNYRLRNEFLLRQIKKLKQQQTERQLQQNPMMLDLQAQIEQKSKKAQTQSQINKQLKQVVQGNSDMFQLYQKMCRRCEGIRKANDEISQQIKNSIKKLNELTGKDQNPNLFIMNFK